MKRKKPKQPSFHERYIKLLEEQKQETLARLIRICNNLEYEKSKKSRKKKLRK